MNAERTGVQKGHRGTAQRTRNLLFRACGCFRGFTGARIVVGAVLAGEGIVGVDSADVGEVFNDGGTYSLGETERHGT